MVLQETDEHFLARHDFETWVPPLKHENFFDELSAGAQNRLENFLYHHARESFTIGEMQTATGVSVSIIQKFLKTHKWAKPTLKRKDGMVTRYLSMAPRTPTTPAGRNLMVWERDRLTPGPTGATGKEAREDFYLMSQRGLGGKRTKVIARF